MVRLGGAAGAAAAAASECCVPYICLFVFLEWNGKRSRSVFIKKQNCFALERKRKVFLFLANARTHVFIG